MSTLHILSSAPHSDLSFTRCLSLLNPDDGLLLCGNAVYALKNNASLAAVDPSIALYALDEDLHARGLTHTDNIQVIDYPGFVALSLHYDKVNSWL